MANIRKGVYYLWMPKYRIEASFRRRLLAIARLIVRRVKGKENPSEIRRALLAIARTKEYRHLAQSAAMKMVTGLFTDQGHTWRQAAAASMKNRKMYEALMKDLRGDERRRLKTLIDEVTYRIRSLPITVGHEVADYIERESLKGRRHEDIAQEILKMFPKKTNAKAELIARTQISITSTNMTRQRAESLGWNFYIWHATGDVRTRDSHNAMNGVIVGWDDPPAPEDLHPTIGAKGKPYKNTLGHYHAGCCPNCRCYPEPILSLDDVTFPAKLYGKGKIRTVSREYFKEMSGLRE